MAYQPIHVPIRGRRLNQLNARAKVCALRYLYFDSLSPACRAYHREKFEWIPEELIRCGAGDCKHQKETPRAV